MTTLPTPRKGHYISSLVDSSWEEQEQIFTYVEAVNYPSISYASNDVTANASAVMIAMTKLPPQTSVQYKYNLQGKTPRCSYAFVKPNSKSIIIKGLLLKFLDNMPMFWAARPTVHLRQLGQYCDTLLWLGGRSFLTSKIKHDNTRHECKHSYRFQV